MAELEWFCNVCGRTGESGYMRIFDTGHSCSLNIGGCTGTMRLRKKSPPVQTIVLTPELRALMDAAVAWNVNQLDIESGADEYSKMEQADDAAWSAMSNWARSAQGQEWSRRK